MREFTRDEQATTISPSSMFKSSFAREVVQNVRRSMSSVNQDSLGSNINNRTEDVATVALNNSIRNSIISAASLKASTSSASAASSADDKGGGGARTKSVRK